jgi:hypothetical protein
LQLVSPEPATEEYTYMPDDFIPQVNVMKAIPEKDPTPIEDRFQHLSAIDKRNQEQRGDKSSFPSISIDQFQDRLKSLRQGTVKWGAARIEAYFVAQINREYDDLKINDRSIESSADFCDWIKKGPWNNYMRGIVAYKVAFCGAITINGPLIWTQSTAKCSVSSSLV